MILGRGGLLGKQWARRGEDEGAGKVALRCGALRRSLSEGVEMGP